MNRIPYETCGFAFENEELLEKAIKEEEGIRYIKNSANLKDPKMVLQIYSQMVRQRLFETPVGYVFLKELQDYLKTEPMVSNQEIPAIPVAVYREKPIGAKGMRSEHTDENRTSRKPKSSRELRKKPVKTKTKTKIIRKTEVRNVDYKPWFRASLSVSIILLFIVIGMFVVTATSGNINIVNYENALIEKYENWETQLKEKEEKLKEKERAISQSQGEDTF